MLLTALQIVLAPTLYNEYNINIGRHNELFFQYIQLSKAEFIMLCEDIDTILLKKTTLGHPGTCNDTSKDIH